MPDNTFRKAIELNAVFSLVHPSVQVPFSLGELQIKRNRDKLLALISLSLEGSLTLLPHLWQKKRSEGT